MKYIMYSTPKTVNIDSKVIEDLEQKILSKEPLTKIMFVMRRDVNSQMILIISALNLNAIKHKQ